MAELTAEQRARILTEVQIAPLQLRVEAIFNAIRRAGFAIIPLEPDEDTLRKIAWEMGREGLERDHNPNRIILPDEIDRARAAYSTIAGGADD